MNVAATNLSDNAGGGADAIFTRIVRFLHFALFPKA